MDRQRSRISEHVDPFTLAMSRKVVLTKSYDACEETCVLVLSSALKLVSAVFKSAFCPSSLPSRRASSVSVCKEPIGRSLRTYRCALPLKIEPTPAASLVLALVENLPNSRASLQ